jgi:hypothetical protein
MDSTPSFSAQYAHVKDVQADHIFDEIIEIADDDSQDIIFVEADDASGKSAKAVKNREFIERSRLRVDARKWIVSKLLPRKYGDRLINEHTGADGGVIAISAVQRHTVSDDFLAAIATAKRPLIEDK